MKDSWDEMNMKEIKNINAIYLYCLKTFLAAKDCKKIEYNEYRLPSGDTITCDMFSDAISIDFRYRNLNGDRGDLWLHRYAIFPKILPGFTYIRIPNPHWGLGFIEKFIITFNKGLFSSLINKDDIFFTLEAEMQLERKKMMEERKNYVFTQDSMRMEIAQTSEFDLRPECLSFQTYKEDIKVLLSS